MILSKAEMNNPDSGRLQVVVTSSQNNFPVPNATVDIQYGDTDQIIEELTTSDSGQTEEIELQAPPLEYSMEPGLPRPYSEYTITVQAPGYETATVAGTEILPDASAIQPVRLKPLTGEEEGRKTVLIPDHTLYGIYPPKIAESEIKPVGGSGEIVLARVVVPEGIVVHDGAASNTTKTNYYVPYVDYIKNVASGAVYATWPESAITANILAIMSFTINRIYTEWYRKDGYDFTITSSTSYDHKFIFGRNIYKNISAIVDEIFTKYLSRPNVKQPILTQYCDGSRVSCPNWLSQWGSKNLGDQGYTPVEILRYYYGDNLYINTAEQVCGLPASWPGVSLDIGSTGDDVKLIQEQLNAISSVYTAIPVTSADGICGEETQSAIRAFQSVFGLSQTGVADYRTWFKISQIYVAITKASKSN